MITERLFDQICEEFGVVKAIRVVEFDATVLSVSPKKKDFAQKGRFIGRCKKVFSRTHWDDTDVDEIAKIQQASRDFESMRELDGLGGCPVPLSIAELIK